MKAYVFDHYSGHEALRLTDVPKPVPGDDQMLVKIHAVCINDWDYGNLHGKPWVMRLTIGLTRPKIKVMGSDISGIVESVGKNVTGFKVGDAVYGDLSEQNWGGFAQYVCVNETSVEHKPADMTFEQAAAIPQAAELAYQGLIDSGDIKEGQDILINGAGGGVGTFGVQIAKMYKATVTGVDNASKLHMMTENGFDHVMDYREVDFTKTKQQYDLILDNKINRPVFSYLKALKPEGIYATTGGQLRRLFHIFLLSGIVKAITGKQIRVVVLKPNRDLAIFNDMFESGLIRPVIDGKYSFDELPKAFELYASEKHKGKLVITVNEHKAERG